MSDLVALAVDHAAARDYERAIDLYARALQILFDTGPRPGDLEEKARLRNARAELLLALGRWQQALGELDRVLAVRSDLADPALVVRAQVLQAQILGAYGEYEQARAVLVSADSTARSLDQPLEKARVQVHLGALLARTGRHREGEQALSRALELLPELPLDADAALLRATALSQLGLAAFRGRRGDRARDLYQQSLELLSRQAPDSEIEAETWRFLGVLDSVRGRFTEALRHLRQALRLYLRNRVLLGQARVHNSLGQTCLEMGRLDEALLFLQKAERICLELGAEAELAAIYGKLGSVYLHREDYARAVDLHRRDVELCRRFGNARALAFAVRNLGLSLRARGDLEEAGACLAEALYSFQSLQDQALAMRVHLDLAEVWLDWGRLPEADRNLQKSRECLHQDSPDPDRARLWLLTGNLERMRQRREDAQEAYLEALRILAEVGPSAALAEARFELGQLHIEARDVEQAVYHLRECLTLARQLGITHLSRKAMQALDRLDQVEVVDLLLEELEDSGSGESGPSSIP